jgi:hypothetical protein
MVAMFKNISQRRTISLRSMFHVMMPCTIEQQLERHLIELVH